MRVLKSQKDVNPLNHNNNLSRAVESVDFARALLSSILTDARISLASHYSNADYLRDLSTLNRRLDNEGMIFATHRLPELSSYLLSLTEDPAVASLPFWKLKKGTKHPCFLHRLFRLAFNVVYNAQVRTKAFDLLYSFASAFKKYRGSYPDKVLLSQFEAFVETDKELDSLSFLEDEKSFELLERARSYIADWMRDFTLDKLIRPRPGPGATNEPTKKHERYRPRVLYKQVHRVMPIEEWWYNHPWDVCDGSRNFLRLLQEAIEYPRARFKFVPKTAGKPRGICIEENEMQVMQQAIRHALNEEIEKLYPSLSLDDQSINAFLAFLASIDKDDATIDMSEASDRISRHLVSWLFQDNIELHDVLMALSTKFIEPPSELRKTHKFAIKTNKFAPMGSALCFPVMSLVHLALVYAIVNDYTEHNNLDSFPLSRIHVYGDDIVVPSICVEHVYEHLPKFGMKLNKNKSYYRGCFRESCGMHAYNGVCVTPVYVKYKPFHDAAGQISSAQAVESLYFYKGMPNAARTFRSYMHAAYGKLPEVPMHMGLRGLQRYFNDADLRRFKKRCRRKWDKELQCYLYKVVSVEARVEKCELPSQREAYLRQSWLHCKTDGEAGTAFSNSSIGDSTKDFKIVSRCVPESAIRICNPVDVLKPILSKVGQCVSRSRFHHVIVSRAFRTLAVSDGESGYAFV